MACGCRNKKSTKYVWTALDGVTTVVYDTEIQAKAKVLRKGGSYQPVPPGA